MIELAIEPALTRLTGLDVYPLLLPSTKLEGVTYQRISDLAVTGGLSPTGLYDVRMQITLYLLNNPLRLLELDQLIWAEWRNIVHGNLEGQPVNLIQRSTIQQDKTVLADNTVQCKLVRDYILTVAE